jgi:ankyrin repeat protein
LPSHRKWCDVISGIVINIDAFEVLAKYGTEKMVFKQLIRLTDRFPENLKLKAMHNSASRGHY